MALVVTGFNHAACKDVQDGTTMMDGLKTHPSFSDFSLSGSIDNPVNNLLWHDTWFEGA